jgi:hypothetical protein
MFLAPHSPAMCKFPPPASAVGPPVLPVLLLPLPAPSVAVVVLSYTHNVAHGGQGVKGKSSIFQEISQISLQNVCHVLLLY